MDNARYHWITLALEFYSNNGIKVIDWPPYSPDLNPIENIWAFMKKQLEGKRFATINQLKNKLYDIWESFDEGMVERYTMSIYNRIKACIESNGCLTNYK